MKGIVKEGPGLGIVYTGEKGSPPEAPYFVIQFEDGAGAGKLVLAAGVCSEGVGEKEEEIRRYAVALLQGFFSSKGAELGIADYRLALRRIFNHIHKNIAEKWKGETEGLDFTMVLASASRAYAARCGEGDLYLFHEGEARSVFGKEGSGSSMLGLGSWREMDLDEAPLQPGDIMVLCNPPVAGVIKARDITLILRRASEPSKAKLFLSAIAERKGATGTLSAVIWQVPNFEGAAILTEETRPSEQEGPPTAGEGQGEGDRGMDQAELVKRRWLNLWKRRKG